MSTFAAATPVKISKQQTVNFDKLLNGLKLGEELTTRKRAPTEYLRASLLKLNRVESNKSKKPGYQEVADQEFEQHAIIDIVR